MHIAMGIVNMESYNAVASWTGWPPLFALMLLLAGFAYWMLQRHIDILKEQKASLHSQLTLAKDHSPDALAKQLTDRLHAYEHELALMREDKQTAQTSLKAKESEIEAVQNQIAGLRDQIVKASNLLQKVTDYNLVCPHCGAPLIIRDGHSELGEYEGREIEVDHEYSQFECGFEIFDGSGRGKCPRTTSANMENQED
ncbi:MAG: hypothetical protein IPH75_14835 [bacterium]|nr:hypothetical protein [bacterium]